MKQLLYTLTLIVCTLGAYAQPVLTDIEDFAPGDKYQMVNCSDTGVNVGPSGANQSWKFNTLTPHDTSLTTVMMATASPNGSKYPKAKLAIRDSGLTYFVAKNTGMSSLWLGNVDSALGVRYEYADSVLFIKRPFQYQSTFTDVFPSMFYSLSSPTPYAGGGNITVTADGWGSLQVANHTYTNVLRIKVQLNEADSVTVPTTAVVTTNRTTYLWYTAGIKNPLLVISKQLVQLKNGVSTINFPRQTASYFYDPTLQVEDAATNVVSAKAWFAGNELMLQGAFNTNTEYTLLLGNMSGTTVFTGHFTGSVQTLRFDIGDLPTGIYTLRAIGNNTTSKPEVIKLFKP